MTTASSLAGPGAVRAAPTAHGTQPWFQASPGVPQEWGWRAWGRDRAGVTDATALTSHISRLALPGAWGTLENANAAVRVAVRRVPGGYVIETGGDPARGAVRRLKARGAARDTIARPAEVARVLWQWCHNSRVEGYELS